jgi:hypothetical protein
MTNSPCAQASSFADTAHLRRLTGRCTALQMETRLQRSLGSTSVTIWKRRSGCEVNKSGTSSFMACGTPV